MGSRCPYELMSVCPVPRSHPRTRVPEAKFIWFSGRLLIFQPLTPHVYPLLIFACVLLHSPVGCCGPGAPRWDRLKSQAVFWLYSSATLEESHIAQAGSFWHFLQGQWVSDIPGFV